MHNHYTTNTPVAQVRDMHDHCTTNTPVADVRDTHALPLYHQHSSYRGKKLVHCHCATNTLVTEVRDPCTTTIQPTPQLHRWETCTTTVRRTPQWQTWETHMHYHCATNIPMKEVRHVLPLYHQHPNYRGERHMHYHCSTKKPSCRGERHMHHHCATNTPGTELRGTCIATVPPTPQFQRWEAITLPLYHQHPNCRSKKYVHYNCTTNPPSYRSERKMHYHCYTYTTVGEVRDTCTVTVPPTPKLQRCETHALPLCNQHASNRGERQTTTV